MPCGTNAGNARTESPVGVRASTLSGNASPTSGQSDKSSSSGTDVNISGAIAELAKTEFEPGSTEDVRAFIRASDWGFACTPSNAFFVRLDGSDFAPDSFIA